MVRTRNNFERGNWLEIKNVDLYYDKRKVLKNINFSLPIGENTVIIGANGSGKSTLIKTICKIQYPFFKKDSHIKIFGYKNMNIWNMRSKISFVITELDQRLKKELSVEDLILSGFQGTFGLLNRNLIKEDQIISMQKTLNLLGIKFQNKFYSELSDGQKRLALIARAVVIKPKVLILDEPSSMLDVKSNYQLMHTLSQLTKEGITLFYATNDINNIIKDVSNVIFMKEGRIILQGNPNNVINSSNVSRLYNYNLGVTNVRGYWSLYPISEDNN